tara:strand:+ start:161 stop:361 length:201 start_codon:yes stop_codon:yes gene_type:complete
MQNGFCAYCECRLLGGNQLAGLADLLEEEFLYRVNKSEDKSPLKPAFCGSLKTGFDGIKTKTIVSY